MIFIGCRVTRGGEKEGPAMIGDRRGVLFSAAQPIGTLLLPRNRGHSPAFPPFLFCIAVRFDKFNTLPPEQ